MNYKTLKSLQLNICICFLKKYALLLLPHINLLFMQTTRFILWSAQNTHTAVFILYHGQTDSRVLLSNSKRNPGNSPRFFLPRAASSLAAQSSSSQVSRTDIREWTHTSPDLFISSNNWSIILFFCTELSLHNLWTPTLSKFSVTCYLLLNMKNCPESHRL